MKILFTTEEGGKWFPANIVSKKGDVFALCLPDGTIWDKVIGVDKDRMKKETFDMIFRGEVSDL